MSSEFDVRRNIRAAPRKRFGSESASSRSPLTQSTPRMGRALRGSRVTARTGTFSSERIRTSSPPMCPVAPVTTIERGSFMSHGYDDVPLLVSLFDIPMSLGNFLQWIASVDDGPQLPRLDELLQEDEVCRLRICNPADHSLTSDCRPQ